MNENKNDNKDENQKENIAAPSTITIDLDALDSTKPLGEGKLIFYDECVRMVKNIRKKAGSNIKKLKLKDNCNPNEADDDSQGTPNCFFIDGPRGSGKSTLLRAVKHNLISSNHDNNKESEIQIFSLADVDPTELGKGENFFIYLLGKIYLQLQDRIKQSNGRDSLLDKIRTALSTIRDMSGGLQMLMDSEEILKRNETPEFFLENCIEKCADSSTMREKFSSLVDDLAQIINTDVFLITIDDADLNFSKCEDILEYIRKYMHSPRLIFLFAGDMQLYSQIVRGMQLQNFHVKQLRYDSQREDNRNQLLDSIEEQYLMKLFPVDNRIRTSSLKTIVDENRIINIHISQNNKDNQEKDQDIISTLVTYLKIKVEEGTIDTIMLLPLRSVLFLLRYLVKNPLENNTPEAAIYTWKGIQEIFQLSLIEHNVNRSQIGTKDIRILQKTILKYHARAGLWQADLSMQANEGETKSRQVALCLAGGVSQSSMSLSMKIKYWCACFPLWQRVKEEYIYVTYESEAHEFLNSCLELTNAQQRGFWADLACAAVAPNSADPLLFNLGVICLLNDDCAQDNEIGQDERRGFKSLANTILNREKFENDDDKLATAAINTCLCRIDNIDNSYYHISIYHLLMNIAEWLDFGYEKFTDPTNLAAKGNSEEQVEKIKNEISIRMTKGSVAHQTPGISSSYRRSRHYANTRSARLSEISSRDKTELPVQRITHTYKCDTSSKIVEKMYNWLKQYFSCSYVSSSTEFSNAWGAFQGACSKLAFDRSNDSEDIISPYKPSSILLHYMEAVEHAAGYFSTETGLSLFECISSFPLWKALKASLEHPSILKTNLDKANIGMFINFKFKEKYHQYKLKRDVLAEKVSRLKSDTEKAQSQFSSAQKEQEEARKQMIEMETKYKRIQDAILTNLAKQQEIESACKRLLDEELHLQQDILNYKRKESEIEQHLKQIQQSIDRIERVMNGDSVDFPEYSIMMEYIQQHLQHKYKTRIESAKHEHQAAIDAIKREIRQLQQEEKGKLPKDAYPLALENRKKYQHTLDDVRSNISIHTIKKTEISRDRVLKDKELSSIKERLDEFYKIDYKAHVDYETAKLKYSISEKYANETKDIAIATINELEQVKKMYSKAENDCKNFKTFKSSD